MSPLPRMASRVIAWACLAIAPAWADDRSPTPQRLHPAYVAECASCHLAYPPTMLPAASWHRILRGLDQHYGVDASLDEATVRQLSAWLSANAGTGRRAAVAPPDDRITRSNWFVREHRDIPSAVWALPSVKSAAQCAACHRGAEQGRFDDNDLIRPPGLTPAQGRAWSD